MCRQYGAVAGAGGQSPQLPHSSLLASLQAELRSLYQTETGRACRSTYSQALLELCLAVTEVTGEIVGPTSAPARSLSPGSDREISPGDSQPAAAGRRQPGRRSGSGSGDQKLGQGWFERAASVAGVLQYLVTRQPEHWEAALKYVQEVYQLQPGPDDHTRLLVISGLPRHLEPSRMETCIRAAISPYCGLFRWEGVILVGGVWHSDKYVMLSGPI